MIVLREVAGRLHANVKQSTQAINRLHNLLARVFPELANLTDDITACWVLEMLDKYPTAQRIGQARLASLQKIPYLAPELAGQLHLIAQQSIACLSGDVAEALVRDLVGQVRHTQRAEEQMRRLLSEAYAALPDSPHLRVVTIPGIGVATAAAIIAQAVDINRFPTPERFVGYFGSFPRGKRPQASIRTAIHCRLAPMHMSRKGNDLVRHYLWNAARSGIHHNPAIGALYRRLKARGKRGDVAMGHCMRKLLHLVYAVWKTDRPFDEKHFAWETPTSPTDKTQTPLTAANDPAHPSRAADADGDRRAPAIDPPQGQASNGADTASANETAAGHKRDLPAEKVVTAANTTVAAETSLLSSRRHSRAGLRGQRSTSRSCASKSAWNRSSAIWDCSTSCAAADCNAAGPVPSTAARMTRSRPSRHIWASTSSSASTPSAAPQGNALDLWAAIHKLPVYEAALHLADTLHLLRNREEEPVRTR